MVTKTRKKNVQCEKQNGLLEVSLRSHCWMAR